MPATDFKQDAVTPRKGGILKSWPGKVISGATPGATLIGLGQSLAEAKAQSIPGLCWRCRSNRNPQRSTSNFPDVFCSEECEEEFIHSALASLTLEDCMRMQRRLEDLLALAERAQL